MAHLCKTCGGTLVAQSGAVFCPDCEYDPPGEPDLPTITLEVSKDNFHIGLTFPHRKSRDAWWDANFRGQLAGLEAPGTYTHKSIRGMWVSCFLNEVHITFEGHGTWAELAEGLGLAGIESVLLGGYYTCTPIEEEE